jgi:hypothetical protein
MDFHHQLFDGSLRPNWAGPVTVLSTRHFLGRSKPGHAIKVAGVVVPVQVPKKFLPSGGHQHTFGMGLGFPDLSANILDPESHSSLAQNWARMEQMIAEAAAKTMGWGGSTQTRNLGRLGLPANALHLLLSGVIPRGKQEKAPAPGSEQNALLGELTKMFAIHDVSGKQVRMQRTGSPASFRVSPFAASFSRDPMGL